ncbi:GUN4 domain-containing protein [Prochlorothrix hollandica]|uniref:GUN4 domain-containing protein n=1 Tax=Prochlorothrix hollandica TaxID=1223 RepID=UPI00034B3008|nr:GUN4 domain-containing protein [Prochlorothrix hollandica]
MKVRQTLIRWMPFGASFALMGNAVLAQDWVQTLLTFPWLAGSTAWAAYSAAFLERLDEVMRDKGSAGADSAVAAVEQLFSGVRETLRRDQLSEFEMAYLAAQAAMCRDYQVEGGSASTFVPMLSEVFVPLELSDVAVRGQEGQLWPVFRGLMKLQDNQLEKLAAREGLSIWDLLKEVETVPAYRHMAIKAWGGYGKTTLLRNLTFVYGDQTQKAYPAAPMMPFLIYLRNFQLLPGEMDDLKTLDLAQLITQHHIPRLPAGAKLQPPEEWAEQVLRGTRRRALVMWDGLDEVKAVNRPALARWMGQQMAAYPEAVFIITSRPNAYNEVYNDQFTGAQPTMTLFVKPFNKAQQAKFLHQWYLCQESYVRGGRKTPEVVQEAQKSAETLLEQLNQRPELQDLAKNPLLLNLIGTFHRFYPGQELPQRRGELYQEICKLQLGARPLAKRVAMPLPWEEIQEVLQGVALAMVKQELRTVTEKPLLRLLGQMLQRLETEQETEQETDRGADSGLDLAPGVAVEPAEFLRTVVRVSELLVEREAQEYEFSHLSFQNYLAALEVKRTQQEKLMLQSYDKPAWKEPILLYGAQMRNPAGLIRKLCGIGDKMAVELAYTIWQESTRKLGPDMEQELAQLAEQVQLFRFRDLENFLKNGEWQKADRETYRLMITAVGKEEGQAFEPEELLNFPWEELLKIDGLWRNYSNNRYGFSIQKEIYVKCGGKLDGSYPGDKLWTAFGKEVGWHVNDRWLGYSDLEWGGTGVLGHLPGGEWKGRGIVVSLLSHRDL